MRSETSGGTRRWWLRLPDHREIGLSLDADVHPLLGRCDRVLDGDGSVLALGTTIDWRRPSRIPALDRPGALPRGAGTALLNLLAWQAQRARSGPLRYAGPYPSEALWSTLGASFRVEAPDEARARFLADAVARMSGRALEPIDVDFHPAPHVWTWTSPRVCVQRRHGIERVYVDGRPFDREGPGPWRLFEDEDALVAGIELGGERGAELLRLDLEGHPRQEPRGLPPPPAELVGTPLPEPVVEVLCEIVAAQAPRGLEAAVREHLAGAEIRWGDPGSELVRSRPGAFELHAALVPMLPTDPTLLLGTLVQLLQPVVRRAAAAALAETWAARAP